MNEEHEGSGAFETGLLVSPSLPKRCHIAPIHSFRVANMPANNKRDAKAPVKPAVAAAAAPVETAKITRRYKPGTVALRRIHKQQKLRDPIVSKSPLKRMMAQYLQKHLDNQGGFPQKGKAALNPNAAAPRFHISPSAVDAMADIVDSLLLKLLANSQKLASIDNTRITVRKDEVYVAAELMSNGRWLPPRKTSPAGSA